MTLCLWQIFWNSVFPSSFTEHYGNICTGNSHLVGMLSESSLLSCCFGLTYVEVYYVFKPFSIRKKAFQSDGQSFVSSALTCHGPTVVNLYFLIYLGYEADFVHVWYKRGKLREMKNGRFNLLLFHKHETNHLAAQTGRAVFCVAHVAELKEGQSSNHLLRLRDSLKN